MIVFAAVVRYVSREIFGPVLPIIAVEDIDNAIRVINSKYVLLYCHLNTSRLKPCSRRADPSRSSSTCSPPRMI